MRVLAISTHADDETLGCGGTLLRHSAAGDQLYWVVVTRVHEPRWSAESIRRKSNENERVALAYGFEQSLNLGFPSVQLDKEQQVQLIERIQEPILEIQPSIVYLVHAGDVHTDHHAVFTATLSVLKAFYMQKFGVKRILSYETLSSTEAAPAQIHRAFAPNVYCDISPYIDRKIEIMELYQTEAQRDPLPRGSSAIRALARYRGATVGVDFAEAFMLIRELG